MGRFRTPRSRRQARPVLEPLEDRRLLTTAANGYLIAFTAALKVGLNGIRLGGIFVMRPDGSGLRQLTSFQTLDFNYELHGLNLPDDQPDFSPDGTKIVFTSNRDAGPRIGLSDKGFEIYTMNVNGTDITRLTNSPGLDTEPVYSPDGSKIAFTSARAGTLDIWVMNANGSNPVQLTTSPLEDIEPQWSPDGTKISFTRVEGPDDKDVFVMNADGSNQHQITFTPGQDHDAHWSPDGTQMVITSERDGSPPFGDVFKINATTGAAIADLTSDLDFGGGDPSWSPDGKQVVFFKDDTPIKIPPDLVVPPIRLWIMNADGSGKQVFPSQGLLNVHPAWGIAADSDHDGRLDYLENNNTTFDADNLGGGPVAPGDMFGTAIGTGDLSFDGKPDLEIGVPGATVNGLPGAGRVDLAQGTPQGPDFEGIHFAQLSPSSVDASLIGATPVAGGHFGQTIAVGDFQGIGHGFNFTVIGAPGQNQVFVGNTPFKPWEVLTGSGGFGSALAVGDFNGDGRQDLAVGSPQGLVRAAGLGISFVQAGTVSIFYGSASGLSSTPAQVLSGSILAFSRADLPPAAGDQFGYALAAGDVTGDRASDLVIGVPGRDVNGVISSGEVAIVPGIVGAGLDGLHAIVRDGTSLPAPYTGLQAGARFGEVLAAGAFHGGLLGSVDLAVGIPRQDIGGVPDAGLVALYVGKPAILTAGEPATTASAFTMLDLSPPRPGQTLTSSRFGQTLAVADFTGDAVQDLAIAAPGQAVGANPNAGLVFIVPGSSAQPPTFGPGSGTNLGQVSATSGGLLPASAQQVNVSQLNDIAAPNDQIGFNPVLPSANTLGAGDIDGDGQADLFIGEPAHNISGLNPFSGQVGLRYGVKVGTFALRPSVATVLAAKPITYTLVWTHPQNWHDLTTVQLQIVGAGGILAWVQFDSATGGLSLYDPLHQRFSTPVVPSPGRHVVLRAPRVALDVSRSAVIGSGATGRTLTLQLSLRFGPRAAGKPYLVQVAATDRHGNSQGFNRAGALFVARGRR